LKGAGAVIASSTGKSHGKVGINARLLDGSAERDGRSLFEWRGIEVRATDNAGDYFAWELQRWPVLKLGSRPAGIDILH
jgi:hypothetical protein